MRSSWNKKSRSDTSYQYRPKTFASRAEPSQFQHHKRKSHPTITNPSTNFHRTRIPNRNHNRNAFRPKSRKHQRSHLNGLIDIFGDYQNDGVERREVNGKRVYSIDFFMSRRQIPEYQSYDGPILPKEINRQRSSMKQYREGSQSFGAYVRQSHRRRPHDKDTRQEKGEKILNRKPPLPLVRREKVIPLRRTSHVSNDSPTKPPLRHKYAKISFDEIEEEKVQEKSFDQKESQRVKTSDIKIPEVVDKKLKKSEEKDEQLPSPPEPIEVEKKVVEVVEETKTKKKSKQTKTKKKKTMTKKRKRKKKKKFHKITDDDSSFFSIWVLVMCLFIAVVSVIVVGIMPSESYEVSRRGDADWVSAVSSRKRTISDSFGSMGTSSIQPKFQNSGLPDYDFVLPVNRRAVPGWASGFVPS